MQVKIKIRENRDIELFSILFEAKAFDGSNFVILPGGTSIPAEVMSEMKVRLTLREKRPNTEFFLVRIFPYSAQMRENTDQKKTAS